MTFLVLCLLGFSAATVPAQESRTGNGWAVLVGVNEYIDRFGNLDLKYCDNDAKVLKDVLMNNFGFHEERIFCLTSPGTTKNLPVKNNIETVIGKIADLADPGDMIMVLLCGHGGDLDGKQYFFPSDLKRNDIPNTALPIEWVFETLEKSRATHKFIVVDACRERIATTRAFGTAVLSQVKPKPSSTVSLLQSCSANQFSHQNDEAEHGAFSYFFLEGLRGAARNQDKVVTLRKLAEYTEQKTKDWVFAKYNEVQHPTLSGNLEDFAFIDICVTVAIKRDDDTPPPPTPRAETLRDSVQVAKPKTREELIQIRAALVSPSQKGIDVDTLTEQEIQSATLQKIGARGYILKNSAGVIIRTLFDTDGDGQLDFWGFYKNGVEVYYEMDTDADRIADRFSAGTFTPAGTFPDFFPDTKKIQENIAQIQELEKRLAETPKAGRAPLYDQIIGLRLTVAKLFADENDMANRDKWLRDLADFIYAVTVDGYATGLEKLKMIGEALKNSNSEIAAYMRYREIDATYILAQTMPNPPPPGDTYNNRIKGLEQLVVDFPGTSTAAQVLLDLIGEYEMMNRADDAKKAAQSIISAHPNTLMAKKAAGFLRRMDSVGKVFPFQGTSATGATIDVKQYNGKIVLLYFWASWADPTGEDAVAMKRIQTRYERDGLSIIGINLDESAEAMQAYVTKNATRWPNIHEPGGQNSRPAVDAGVNMPPFFILLDKKGTVVNNCLLLLESVDLAVSSHIRNK